MGTDKLTITQNTITRSLLQRVAQSGLGCSMGEQTEKAALFKVHSRS